MNLSFIIIRAVLGLVFFALGVFLSRNFLADFQILGNPYLAPTLAALLSGVFGVFVVPFLAERIRRWFESLIRATVMRALAEWTRQVGKQVGRAVEQRRKLSSAKLPKAPKHPRPSIILDTSAIIDGRLRDVIHTGFLDASLIVPQFVLDELQHLADSPNDLKRQRGRRGLEILAEIKSDKGVIIERSSKGWRNGEDSDVDKQLVQLARDLKAKIATVDYNLNKAASVSGIQILNVNELANAIKTAALPGESLEIKVVQKGKEAGQGVGYLSDGTMVVVEDGDGLVGKKIKVKVSRVLQTAAGRMVFAKLQG